MPSHYFRNFGARSSNFGRPRRSDFTPDQQRMLAEQHLGQLGLLGGPAPVDPQMSLLEGRLADAQGRTRHAQMLQQGTLGQTPIPNATGVGNLARMGATGEVFRPGNRTLSPQASPALAAALERDASRRAELAAQPLGQTGIIRDYDGNVLGMGVATQRPVPTTARRRRADIVAGRRARVAERGIAKGRARTQRLQARALQREGLSPLQALAMAGGGGVGGDMQNFALLSELVGPQQAATIMAQRAAIQGRRNIADMQERGLQGRAQAQNELQRELSRTNERIAEHQSKARQAEAQGRLTEMERHNKAIEGIQNRQTEMQEQLTNQQLGIPIEGVAQTPQSALENIVRTSGEEAAEDISNEIDSALAGNFFFRSAESRLGNLSKVVNDAVVQGLSDPEGLAAIVRSKMKPGDRKSLQRIISSGEASPELVQLATMLGIEAVELPDKPDRPGRGLPFLMTGGLGL